MITQSQLAEIRTRLETTDTQSSLESLDRATLFSEVERLQHIVQNFTATVNGKLIALEEDMLKLEQENARLRSVCESTYFERDACIGLISKMALRMGMPTGTGEFEVAQDQGNGQTSMQKQKRVVVDLPSGQVSWDFLDSEAHLFENLPPYPSSLKEQTVRDIYAKVINPSLDV